MTCRMFEKKLVQLNQSYFEQKNVYACNQVVEHCIEKKVYIIY